MTLLTCTLGAGNSVGKERTMQPSSHTGEEAGRRGQSQLGFGQTGDDCTLECRCETWTW